MPINETSHMKVSLASLSTQSVSSDQWIQYLVRSLSTATLTLALEETAVGVNGWRLLRAPRLELERKFLAFRSGPVFEAEAGMRLLNGKRVSAETYLKFHESLKVQDFGVMAMDLLADISVERVYEKRIRCYQDHVWGIHPTIQDHGGDMLQVQVRLDCAEAFAFLEALNATVHVNVTPSSRHVARAGETIDMFA